MTPTDKQLEVLKRLANDQTVKQIAAELNGFALDLVLCGNHNGIGP